MKRELTAIIFIFAFIFFLGSVAGYGFRTLKTADKTAIAKFEKDIAERDFYRAYCGFLEKEYLRRRGN